MGNSDDGEEDGVSGNGWFEKRNFSCRLHMDTSKVFREDYQIPHQNQISAGHLLLDMVHLPTMTTVQALQNGSITAVRFDQLPLCDGGMRCCEQWISIQSLCHTFAGMPFRISMRGHWVL